ncbi:MAG TPA: caspase family protein [Croceibacterium sp.]|nr:caspase family protein [Croceibacterium sp.]
MRAFAVFVVALVAIAAAPATAHPQRIALVVGNNDYHGGLHRLTNARNDAELMTAVLKKAGFDVEPVVDARRPDLAAAISRFTQRLKQAGPDAVGLFYFAGHGLQYDGTNYLLATDATVEDPADISRKGVDAVQILWALQDGGAATSILIIDACRQDRVSLALRPVAEDGLTRLDKKGLDKRRNVIVAYSTGPGEAAADGERSDGNSPFAKILAENILVPNKGIIEMFRNVTVEMVENFDQKPWLDLGWTAREEFVFVGGS